MITIDDVEYKEDDLFDKTELQIISAYANAIKQSVKPVENEGEIVNE